MIDQEIYELMARFESSPLTRFRLVTDTFELELERALPAVTAPVSPVPAQQVQAAPAPQQAEVEDEGLYITAPLVGTFYVAPEPGADPFVRPGQAVKKGESVGLLEAMKMMSEIQAPCDCVIEEVLPQDGALVSFGEALIRYREA